MTFNLRSLYSTHSTRLSRSPCSCLRIGVAWRRLALSALLAPLVAQSQIAAPGSSPAQTPSGGETSGSRSAFEGYRAHTNETIVDWKHANDEVARIGGWRAYAREVQVSGAPRRDPGSAGSAREPERENTPSGSLDTGRGTPEAAHPANVKP